MSCPTGRLQELRDLSDRCVQCGLCLPHCPTYGATRREALSPRGRIVLLGALAEGRLSGDEVAAALDSCLGCRACEAMCPSNVEYERALVLGLSLLGRRGSAIEWLLRRVLAGSGAGARQLRKAVRWFGRSGLRRTLQPGRWLGTGTLARLEAALPAAGPRPLGEGRAEDTGGGERVLLFGGCSGDLLNARALAAGQAVLHHLGYRVELLSDGYCCGALEFHGGELERGTATLTRTVDALAGRAAAHLLVVDSACAAQLAQATRWCGATPQARRVEGSLEGLAEFIDRVLPQSAPLRPLAATVAVHTPCSQRNGLRRHGAAGRLLRRIPTLRVVELEQTACCGAGGSRQFRPSPLRQRLLDDQVAALTPLQADYLVTGNIGCALHLARGLHASNMSPRVIHPIELLADALCR